MFKTVVEKEARWKNSMSQAELEHVTSTRVHAGFGVPSTAARGTLDGDVPSVSIRKTHGLGDTLSSVSNVAQGFGTPALSQTVSMVCCASSGWTALEGRTARNRRSRVCFEFDSAELEREEVRTMSTSSPNAFDDGSANLTATLCSTQAFSEHLAFVGVLRHNVIMPHSDHKPVLV